MTQTIQLEKVSNGYIMSNGSSRMIASNEGEVAQIIAKQQAHAVCCNRKVGELFYIKFEYNVIEE